MVNSKEYSAPWTVNVLYGNKQQRGANTFFLNFATNAVFYFPVFHSIRFLVTHNTLIILFIIPYLHSLTVRIH